MTAVQTSRVGQQACAPGLAGLSVLSRLSIAATASEVAQIESSGDAPVSKPHPKPGPNAKTALHQGLAQA